MLMYTVYIKLTQLPSYVVRACVEDFGGETVVSLKARVRAMVARVYGVLRVFVFVSVFTAELKRMRRGCGVVRCLNSVHVRFVSVVKAAAAALTRRHRSLISKIFFSRCSSGSWRIKRFQLYHRFV